VIEMANANNKKIKMKTHKGAKKRMRVTRRGKVIARKQNKGHLMSSKTGKRRRSLKRKLTLNKVDAKRYKRVLGK
jgi:large subunit ribosomal protein L35